MKTTREAAKEELHNKKARSLQELLQKNYDAERDFKKAIEKADSSELKKFFKGQAVMHNHFATEIDKVLHALNEHPKEKGTTTGALFRTWLDIKTIFTKKDDEAVLEECIRGEKNSIREYESELKKVNFSPQEKEMLNEHLSKMKMTLQETKRLEDLFD